MAPDLAPEHRAGTAARPYSARLRNGDDNHRLRSGIVRISEGQRDRCVRRHPVSHDDVLARGDVFAVALYLSVQIARRASIFDHRTSPGNVPDEVGLPGKPWKPYPDAERGGFCIR